MDRSFFARKHSSDCLKSVTASALYTSLLNRFHQYKFCMFDTAQLFYFSSQNQ